MGLFLLDYNGRFIARLARPCCWHRHTDVERKAVVVVESNVILEAAAAAAAKICFILYIWTRGWSNCGGELRTTTTKKKP